MELSINDKTFLNAFDHLLSINLDEYGKDKLDLFCIKIKSNEFDYAYLEDMLLDPVIDFALSRTVKKQYAGKSATLSKKARIKFKEYLNNDGELGEFLMFCFLETHLNAPKILSKMELKTSTSLYVNGSDGVHYLDMGNGNYQLIFAEAKMYKRLSDAINKAMNSLYEFKHGMNSKGSKKSGIEYERGLISDNLDKETFSPEEKEFIKSIIYPSKEKNINADDAFGVLIGFEIKISDKEKQLPNLEFRELIHKKVIKIIEQKKDEIYDKIIEKGLMGHHFYFYIIPFTNIEETRQDIIKVITE